MAGNVLSKINKRQNLMKIKNSRKYNVSLPDNRILTWYESGPEQGKPVLFCTGAGMSGLLGVEVDLLSKLNIRLITPTRPGLGDSTFDPKKSLKSFSEDILFLLDHLRIKNINVMGFSQGAVFAMALCVYCHVDKLLIVAGQDQFDYPDTQNKLTDDVVNMQRQAVGAPDLLTSWIKQNITAKWLIDFILNYSADVDLAIYKSVDFLPVYQECMAEAFKQGNDGYTQDLLIAMQPWGFSPEEIKTPTTLWYGMKDTSTVHSPDFGDLLFQRFPNAERHLWPEEGGSLLWTKTEEILLELVD